MCGQKGLALSPIALAEIEGLGNWDDGLATHINHVAGVKRIFGCHEDGYAYG